MKRRATTVLQRRLAALAPTVIASEELAGAPISLGVELAQPSGARLPAEARYTTAPMTNMRPAEHFGVRLLGERDVAPGAGFGVALRGGYQARVFTAGSPSSGLTLRYAF